MNRKNLLCLALATGVIALAVQSCGGSGGGGGISSAPPPSPPVIIPGTPANFASRTTGVAPLAVFFDAVNTSSPAYDSGVVQPGNSDFSSFQYAWDFGDPGSGTWSSDGRSKNADTGFTASHVYETPGDYTISLTVIDSLGDIHAYSQDITVSAFSGTTYYISAAGSDLNDGLTPATAWHTFGKMVNAAVPNRRFLFNRGDTFTTSNEYQIVSSGPGIIGAYGSGARPIIQSTGSGGTLGFSGSDWRLMDLEFSGPGLPSNFGVTLSSDTYSERMLMLRLKSHNYFGPLGWADYPTMYSTPQTEITVAECELTSGAYWCAFVGGRRLAVVGNVMDNVTVEGHALRIWQADKGVVNHNNLSNGTHHTLKLHGPEESSAQAKTRFVQVSDNRITGSIWTVACGPQNSTSDERVTQVVFERNWLEANSDTQEFMKIWARDVTVRNNVFVANGIPGIDAISVQRVGIEPPAARVKICNNTFYKGDAGNDFTAVNVSSQVSDVTVCNNLASAPLVNNDAFLSGSCPGLVVENNLLTNTPGFSNAGALDFTLTAGSAARNAGLTLGEVLNDYTRTTTRPQGAAFDLGAFERD